jgi:methylmalonyl-CoA mutase
MSDGLRDNFTLGSEFPRATREQWLNLVERVLQGESFESKLVAKTYDGLAIGPLSPRSDRASPIVARPAGTAWAVMQRVDHPDPVVANAQCLHDLANGANGLSLQLTGAIGAYGYGLAASEEMIARAVEGVDFRSGIALDLDLPAEPIVLVQKLAAPLKRNAATAVWGKVGFGIDPIGAAAAAGGGSRAWNSIASDFAGLLTDLAAQGLQGPFAPADARIVHNAGGSEAQELAYALAVAVEYLRALEAGGVGLDTARRMIYFRLAADADQLLTIAKFRAARKLWARIEEACGLAPASAFIAAETAWRMMTKRDPYANMLRATIAVVSAGIAGANAITVLPFTLAVGLPDPFARRIARNTQLVLLEESNLARVSDPAAGSGSLEMLTDQLCRAAWAEFQLIEKAGGAWTALQQGMIQRKIAAVCAQRQAAVARRKDPLIGTSDFPDLAQAPVAVLNMPRAQMPTYAISIPCEPLRPVRLAEPFEALRDASDAMLSRTGARPKVFLASLGMVSDFGPRANFASNLFEAGGIEALTNPGFSERGEMIAAFRGSPAKLACLCSSDEIYAREASAAAEELRTAGAAVWMAGQPGELEAALRQAGIQGFVFPGCDALGILQTIHSLVAH